MLDKILNPIVLGDYVVLRMPKYSDLCIGRVSAFTNKKVRIQYLNNWNFGELGRREDILVYPGTVCLIQGPRAEATIADFERRYQAAPGGQ